MAEHLPDVYKVLGSTPGSAKQKQKLIHPNATAYLENGVDDPRPEENRFETTGTFILFELSEAQNSHADLEDQEMDILGGGC